MKRTFLKILAVVELVPLCHFAFAQTKPLVLPAIFSDHMVLQAGKPLSIWGKADVRINVNVNFNGQSTNTISDELGNWEIKLKPLIASFTPKTLKIRTGKDSVAFTDVLVGEVWVCSGQSNMVIPLGNVTDPFFGVKDGGKEIAAPIINGIRVYNDNHLEDQQLTLRTWQIADADAKCAFSAVAWFFGKTLYQGLKVPVGLINISAGGSGVQEWMTPESANTDTLVNRYNNIYEANKTEIDNYRQKAYEYWKYSSTNKSLKPPVILSDNVMLAGRYGKLGSLYSRMISPIVPFAIKGFIWYQGESNADYVADAGYYDHLLATMVTDWRTNFKQNSLPFYIVQLPCWNRGPHWPLFKLNQLKAAINIKKSGIVVTSDICDSTDLHPVQKQPVGERLALLALAKTYRKPVVYQGPTVKKITVKNSSLIVIFNTNGKGDMLKTHSWEDVEIADENKKYYPAKAVLINNRAIVNSPNVKSPCFIRYGWLKTYKPSLFNKEGLPAIAFSYAISNKNSFELIAYE
jgi:hypothetical protein